MKAGAQKLAGLAKKVVDSETNNTGGTQPQEPQKQSSSQNSLAFGGQPSSGTDNTLKVGAEPQFIPNTPPIKAMNRVKEKMGAVLTQAG